MRAEPSAKVTAERLLQPLNAPLVASVILLSPIETTFFGIFIEVSFEQLPNVSFPIDVIRQSSANVAVVSEVQLKNAEIPIVSTALGIETDLSALQL